MAHTKDVTWTKGKSLMSPFVRTLLPMRRVRSLRRCGEQKMRDITARTARLDPEAMQAWTRPLPVMVVGTIPQTLKTLSQSRQGRRAARRIDGPGRRMRARRLMMGASADGRRARRGEALLMGRRMPLAVGMVGAPVSILGCRAIGRTRT